VREAAVHVGAGGDWPPCPEGEGGVSAPSPRPTADGFPLSSRNGEAAVGIHRRRA